MDGRNDAESGLKVVDVVEMMAAAMGLDVAIPNNPYTESKSRTFWCVKEDVCRVETIKRKAEGQDLVGEVH